MNYSAGNMNSYIQGCRRLNANYTYKLWSNSSILEFLSKEYPWFLPTYNSYPHSVQRSDAARLLILYHYGGVYIDVDITCVKPFDEIAKEISNHDVAMSRGSTFGVSNHVIMAKRRHPYIKASIDALSSHNRWFGLPYITIMYSSGPGFLTVVLNNYTCKEQVYVFPPEPLNRVYYIHKYDGHWHTWDTVVINILGAIHKLVNRVFSWTCVVVMALAVSVLGIRIYYTRKRNISSLNKRWNGNFQSI